jgi:nucleoside-diphosphate-sugar epimerase
MLSHLPGERSAHGATLSDRYNWNRKKFRLRRNFFGTFSFDKIPARAAVQYPTLRRIYYLSQQGVLKLEAAEARLQGSRIVRVFVLGGTGSIGSPTVRELIGRGHDVWALARSDVAAAKLAEFGATPVAGDIASPEPWARDLPQVDAVIHAACDFGTGMGAIDARLLDVLLPALAAQPKKPRFVYTGGCWLFGATSDDVAAEETPFRPLPAFAWMVPQLTRILQAPEVSGIVIHPAMVYAPRGGVFHRFARDAIERDAIRVVESEQVRWPLVHSEDLARLYILALERAPAGASYLGAAIDGLAVGRIARAFARRFGTRHTPPQIVSTDAVAAELGEWARGYALDQRLSGAKAQRDLGWSPRHLDPEREIAQLP